MHARLTALWLFGAACSAGPAPLAQAPGAPPPPAKLAPAASGSLTPPPSTPSPDAPEATLATESAPPPAPPLVVFEHPYSAQGHARLATEMLTLERDEELLQWALGGSSDPTHVSRQANYHPATRVVVDVELQSRAPKGTTNKLLRVARSHGYWPLRACFEAAERLTPRRERSAKVRLTLSAHGKLLGSRSLGSTAEREYVSCVLERVRALDFRPGFSRKLDVDISVKQWPGHAPLPPRAPDQPSPFSLAAAAAFEGLRPALSGCYEQGLKSDSGLWGRIAFHLRLDDTGQVKHATAVETRFPSADVVACARQALLSVRLPAGGVSELSFALRLGQPPAPPPPEAAPASPVGPLPPVPH